MPIILGLSSKKGEDMWVEYRSFHKSGATLYCEANTNIVHCSKNKENKLRFQ